MMYHNPGSQRLLGGLCSNRFVSDQITVKNHILFLELVEKQFRSQADYSNILVLNFA